MADHPLRFDFDIHHPAHRRAARTAVAVLLSAGLVHLINPPHGEWILLSAFIVSQDTIGNSLWKAKGRFWGACLGAIASLMIYALLRQHHILMVLTGFLTIFPYAYLLTALNNYGYAYFFLQVAYVCFLGSIGKEPSVELIAWRAASIAIGCTLGIAVALFVLPTSARPRLQKGQLKAWTDLHHWFEAIVAAYSSSQVDPQHLEELSRSAQRSVFGLDKHLASRKHELFGKLKPGYSWTALQDKDTEFIQAYRPIYESLLYLNQGVQASDPAQRPTKLSRATQDRIHDLETTFEQVAHAISTHSLLQLPPISRVDVNHLSANLTLDELNINVQLQALYQVIAIYSKVRNEFLSLLANN